MDERVDGGLWPQSHWLNRLAYRAYKHIERGLLKCASHVVALTEAVVLTARPVRLNEFAPLLVSRLMERDSSRVPSTEN